MLIGPFLLLFTIVLGWAIIPPTLLFGLSRLKTHLKRKAGYDVRPVPGHIIRRWYYAFFFVSVAFGWSTLFLFYPLFYPISGLRVQITEHEVYRNTVGQQHGKGIGFDVHRRYGDAFLS